MSRLLHFFEATAQFAVALMLSAIRKSEALFERERDKLARADPNGRGPLERSTFGTWTQLGQTLAKIIRREITDPAA